MKDLEVEDTDKGVSAIVGTILIVAITVVMAATIYGVLYGFGGLIGGAAPTGVIQVTNTYTKYTVTFSEISENVSVKKVEIKLLAPTGTYVIGPGLVNTTNPIYFHDDSGPAYNITISTSSLTVLTVITLDIGLPLNQISIVDTSPSGVIATWTSQTVAI